MKILLTGAAGFVGYHVAQHLADRGDEVVGIDNLNEYYSITLKHARLAELYKAKTFRFVSADVRDHEGIINVVGREKPDVILHLAAQAGVRYSLENPLAYVDANVAGQVVMFEAAASCDPPLPVIYASSSSVYGTNSKVPFCERDRVDQPASVYAATKRAGELLAQVYASIYGLRCTGLRFFTVYGRYGRPDMAPWLFTDAILHGRPVTMFDNGQMRRDFTHVSDVVQGVVAAVDRIVATDAPLAPLYNLGNNQPATVLDLIAAIEQAAGKKAIVAKRPAPPGDVMCTYADIKAAARDLGYAPKTSLREGIADFVEWFRTFEGSAAGKEEQEMPQYPPQVAAIRPRRDANVGVRSA